MLTGIEKRKCICCGKEFTYLRGGFILRKPICPQCSSRVNVRVKKFL